MIARITFFFILCFPCLNGLGQDYIEQEYFKGAKVKNAAIAAARYAEEGYYYSKFSTYVSALDSSRSFADTALFFVGRCLMLADTSIFYANENEHAVQLLTQGKDFTTSAKSLIETFYPMEDMLSHRAYGLNAALYLSNAVMEYYNASMVVDDEENMEMNNPYQPLPYADEVARLETDEAAFLSLNTTMEENLRVIEDQIKSIKSKIDHPELSAKKEELEKWLVHLNREKEYTANRLNDSSRRIEDIRELLDGIYVSELAKIESDDRTSSFETGKYDYYSNKEVALDEEMPEGLVYKIQLGYFPKTADRNNFYGLYPITGETISESTVLFYAGMFNNYSDASKGKKFIRENAMPDAFIVPFFNGEKVNVHKAVIIEKGAHTE